MTRQLKFNFKHKKATEVQPKVEQLILMKEYEQNKVNELIGNLPIKIELSGLYTYDYTIRYKTGRLIGYVCNYSRLVSIINLMKQLQQEELINPSQTKIFTCTFKYLYFLMPNHTWNIRNITPLLNRSYNFIYGNTLHNANKCVQDGYYLNRMLQKKATRDKAIRIITLFAEYGKQVALDKINRVSV